MVQVVKLFLSYYFEEGKNNMKKINALLFSFFKGGKLKSKKHLSF
jgi:hypothetical protein